MLELIAAAALLAQDAEPVARYYLDVRPREGEIADVRVSIGFTGETDGETEIVLPTAWGGENALWNSLTDFELEGGELERRDSGLFIARHEPDAELWLRYRVSPDRPGMPDADADDYYRPVVTESFAHLIGHTIFARPTPAMEGDLVTVISTEGDWEIASDMSLGETMNALLTSVTLVGDIRVEERDLAGAPLRVALQGELGLSDSDFADAVLTAARGSNLYWGDEAFPYLVTVLPLTAAPGRSSVGGTNLGDAFAFFSTPSPETFIMMRILAHEYVHNWNPVRLGGALPGADEPAGYWFSEGFTDFITQRSGVLGGAWDVGTGLSNWNEFLAEYAGSPLREAPNSVILEQFWTSGDAQRLPYLRGMIFAALVDEAIRDHTGGAMDIDDVFFAMRDEVDQGPAPARFADTVRETTGLDISGLMTRHIENGEPIELPADAFGACGALETADAPVFVYGMTGERDEQDRFVLVSVDEAGPAWAAGFRPGMILLERIGGAYGDVTQESAFRTLVDGEEREMAYLPTDGRTRRTQQIRPAQGDLQANGCAERLAGRALD